MLGSEAPAKINLTLHITGKRADGYHLLESDVAFTKGLHDEVHIAPADTLTLTVKGEFANTCGNAAKNLVMRAALALQQATGTSHGARIRLIKNIPPGAGLGGGSSDAATALRLLHNLWGGEADLPAIAATLGADVPMFLPYPYRAVHVSGIGDTIDAYRGGTIAPYAVLVYPNVPLATADVYNAYDGTRGAVNDLQATAITLEPEIANVLQAIQAQSNGLIAAHMTGSGSCCFGLYANEGAAIDAAQALARTHSTWWVKRVELN